MPVTLSPTLIVTTDSMHSNFEASKLKDWNLNLVTWFFGTTIFKRHSTQSRFVSGGCRKLINPSVAVMSPPHDDLNGPFVVGVTVNTGVVRGKVVELGCCVVDVVVIACFVVIIRVVVGFFVGVGNKAENQSIYYHC